MKNWVMMYVLIWLAFFQILIVLFPVLGTQIADGIHTLLGVAVLIIAYLISKGVAATACPDRIKRIVKATFAFSVFQAVLGIGLVIMVMLNIGGTVQGIVDFLHVAVALTIITQASSSATAYDMWEEKEFTVAPASAPSTSTL
jgi:hypothetical protein